MTEADALERARTLLAEPARRTPSIWTALAASAVMAALAVGTSALVLTGVAAAAP